MGFFMANTKKIKTKVTKYMKTVREFIANKNNGSVPAEWELSLTMLESYYRQFLELTEEIDSLESVITQSRYGESPSPLLAARDKAAVRLEALADDLGLTMKAQNKMNIKKPKEETPLDKFIKTKIEQR